MFFPSATSWPGPRIPVWDPLLIDNEHVMVLLHDVLLWPDGWTFRLCAVVAPAEVNRSIDSETLELVVGSVPWWLVEGRRGPEGDLMQAGGMFFPVRLEQDGRAWVPEPDIGATPASGNFVSLDGAALGSVYQEHYWFGGDTRDTLRVTMESTDTRLQGGTSIVPPN